MLGNVSVPNQSPASSSLSSSSSSSSDTDYEVHETTADLDSWYRITLISPHGNTTEGYIERPSKSAVRPHNAASKRKVPCPKSLASDAVTNYDRLVDDDWLAVVSDDHVDSVIRPNEGSGDHVTAGEIIRATTGTQTITIRDTT